VAPSAGELVTNNVRLEQPLGEGGMGSVWRAHHLGLELDVAVKFMAPELVGSAEMRERFAREARAAARIDSPHVVRMFDHGVTPAGVPYIVMELCAGETLRDRISARGALAPEQAERVVHGLCLALAAAHAIGIVHRDIKPENVFLHGRDEVVKVLDFGIAKAGAPGQPALTAVDAVMGTPAYMSVEQLFMPASVSPGFDLWAAAVVAYEAVTGQAAFYGDTLTDLVGAVHDGRFTPPSQLGLPVALDAFFARAFERDPVKRYPSARALADAFSAALQSQRAHPPAPVTAVSTALAMAPTHHAPQPSVATAPTALPAAITQPSPVHAPPPAPRSRRWRWLLVVAGLLVVIGGLGVAKRLRKAVAVAREDDGDDNERSRRRRPKPAPQDPAPSPPSPPPPPAPAADVAKCVATWAELQYSSWRLYEVTLAGEGVAVSLSDGLVVERVGLAHGVLTFSYAVPGSGSLDYACHCTAEVTMKCTFTGANVTSLHRVRHKSPADFVGSWLTSDGADTFVVEELAGGTLAVSTGGEPLRSSFAAGVLRWDGPDELRTHCIVAEQGQRLRCVAGDGDSSEQLDLVSQSGW
jgi:serine/threonine-protein kinase